MDTTPSRDPVPDTDPTILVPDAAGLEMPVSTTPGTGLQAPAGATGPGHAATGGS